MTEWREYVRARLPLLPIRAEREREIVDELALQLEAAYHAALAAGRSESEALDCAAAEVPDWRTLAATLTQIEREAPGATASTPARETTGADAMNVRRLIGGFGQDLRLAVRSLARTPGYAALAIGTLALGLGLGAAAFSLVDGVLVRPLPFPDADRLVLVKATVPPRRQRNAGARLSGCARPPHRRRLCGFLSRCAIRRHHHHHRSAEPRRRCGSHRIDLLHARCLSGARPNPHARRQRSRQSAGRDDWLRALAAPRRPGRHRRTPAAAERRAAHDRRRGAGRLSRRCPADARGHLRSAHA